MTLIGKLGENFLKSNHPSRGGEGAEERREEATRRRCAGNSLIISYSVTRTTCQFQKQELRLGAEPCPDEEVGF